MHMRKLDISTWGLKRTLLQFCSIVVAIPDVEIKEVAGFTVLVGNGNPVVCLASEEPMVTVRSILSCQAKSI